MGAHTLPAHTLLIHLNYFFATRYVIVSFRSNKMIAPTNKIRINYTQLSFLSRVLRSRNRGCGLSRTLTLAAIAVVAMMATVKGSSSDSLDPQKVRYQPSVEVTGAGDEEANGWYLRRYHHEGIIKKLYSQAEWDRLNKQVGPWYEKRNGYFIFLDGARDSRYTFWKIRDNHGSSLYLCRPRKTEIVDVMGQDCEWHSNIPPTDEVECPKCEGKGKVPGKLWGTNSCTYCNGLGRCKWQVAHDGFQNPQAEGPAPTLRLVQHYDAEGQAY